MAKNPILQQIKNYLETLIRQNKDSADFRLPSENQLANKFGASRICAKEAYRELEEEHLVRRVQGKGTFINTERSGSLTCEKWISVIFPLVDSTFLHKILGGILDFFKETEYSVFVQYSNQNPELESRQIKAATYNNASGILIYPIDNESYSMELLKLCLNQYPTIVIDRFLPGLTLPLVSSDHYQSAYALTGKMLEMGCRKIFFFVPQAERLTSIATRCSGYEAALRDKKLFPRYQFIDNYADYGEFQCMFLEHFESYPDTDGVIVNPAIRRRYSTKFSRSAACWARFSSASTTPTSPPISTR